MTPRRYGPLAYVPINRRPPLAWPSGARVALWVNPNVEFFGLDDVMPSNLNDRVPRDQARIPNVRNWAVRDYGNRIGVWQLMEVLSRYGIRWRGCRYGIRASAALNSEVCDHHPEIIEEGGKLGWEWIGHNQTNALRLTEMGARAGSDGCWTRLNISPIIFTRRRSGSCRAWREQSFPYGRIVDLPRRAEHVAGRASPRVGCDADKLYLAFEKEVEAALGLPADAHSNALLPIGYLTGVRRVRLSEVVYENRWGRPYS
jgi:hypothetical protein